MSRNVGVRAGALALACAVLVGFSGAAAAAGSLAPALLSPNRKSVNPGHIRLVVALPVKPFKRGVFIALTPRKTRDKHGHLRECFSTTRCDFVSPRQWRGHRYSYVARFKFPGYWAVTPGRYYWQAHYYTRTSVYYSRIGSFVVK